MMSRPNGRCEFQSGNDLSKAPKQEGAVPGGLQVQK